MSISSDERMQVIELFQSFAYPKSGDVYVNSSCQQDSQQSKIILMKTGI